MERESLENKGIRGIRCQYGLNQRESFPVYFASVLFWEKWGEDMRDCLLRIIGVAPEQDKIPEMLIKWAFPGLLYACWL